MAALRIVNLNLPPGLIMKVTENNHNKSNNNNNSNSNNKSNINNNPININTADQHTISENFHETNVGLTKSFSKISVQNVLSENGSNTTLNLITNDNNNPNVIVRKIKDFGMIGTVNKASITTTNFPKRPLEVTNSNTMNNNCNNNMNNSNNHNHSNTNTIINNLPLSVNNNNNKNRRLTKEERTALRLAKKSAKENSVINSLVKFKSKSVSNTASGTALSAGGGNIRLGNSGTPGRKGLPLPQAVARRNARERNRVKQVNNGFAALRERIPDEVAEAYETQSNGRSSATKKLSKVETLRMAVEYIRGLERLLGLEISLENDSNRSLSSGEESFSLVKDEFDILSPMVEEQFDDNLSFYDNDDYFDHQQQQQQLLLQQPHLQLHSQPQSQSQHQNLLNKNNDNRNNDADIVEISNNGNTSDAVYTLPSITTFNGGQYSRIPGTGIYQLLTTTTNNSTINSNLINSPSELYTIPMDSSTQNTPSPVMINSVSDEEHFATLIDPNCVSPTNEGLLMMANTNNSSVGLHQNSLATSINNNNSNIVNNNNNNRSLLTATGISKLTTINPESLCEIANVAPASTTDSCRLPISFGLKSLVVQKKGLNMLTTAVPVPGTISPTTSSPSLSLSSGSGSTCSSVSTPLTSLSLMSSSTSSSSVTTPMSLSTCRSNLYSNIVTSFQQQQPQLFQQQSLATTVTASPPTVITSAKVTAQPAELTPAISTVNTANTRLNGNNNINNNFNKELLFNMRLKCATVVQHRSKYLQPQSIANSNTTNNNTITNTCCISASSSAQQHNSNNSSQHNHSNLIFQQSLNNRDHLQQQQQQHQHQEQEQHTQQQQQLVTSSYHQLNSSQSQDRQLYLDNQLPIVITPPLKRLDRMEDHLIQMNRVNRLDQLEQIDELDHFDQLNHLNQLEHINDGLNRISNITDNIPLQPLPSLQTHSNGNIVLNTFFNKESNCREESVGSGVNEGYFERANTLKKEFDEVLLDSDQSGVILTDESMIETIDWWEAHTPKSEVNHGSIL